MADTETASYEEIVNESDAAWQIKFDDERTLWLPKSQCEVNENDKEVYMPNWLYDKNFI